MGRKNGIMETTMEDVIRQETNTITLLYVGEIVAMEGLVYIHPGASGKSRICTKFCRPYSMTSRA